MTLRELEYLVALADHRHFGRAAEACLVSQPTLSAQIRKLEGEIGAALIERLPRQVMLTAAGDEVATRARRILLEVGQIKEAVSRMVPETGSISLGVFPTLGPYVMPHLVPEIRAKYPQLEILLVEEKSEALIERLRSGKLDAALLALPVQDDQLKSHFLFEEPFLLAVSKAHELGSRSSLPLAELSRYELMLLEDGHCLRDQALEVCRISGAAERGAFRATSLETLRQMVGANVGITLLPALAAVPAYPFSDNINLLEFDDASPCRRIGMFWRRSSAIGQFLETLADLFRASAQQALEAHRGQADRIAHEDKEPANVTQ